MFCVHPGFPRPTTPEPTGKLARREEALPITRQLAALLPQTALVLLISLVSCGRAYAGEPFLGQGPVPARNFQPLQGLSLQMPAVSAVPLRRKELAFRAHVAETSVTLIDETPTHSAVLKLNQLISTFDVRYGLNGTTELGLEVISFYNHSGALDGAISSVERLVAGRLSSPFERLKDSGFAFSVAKDGQSVQEGRNDTWSFSNVILSTKTRLLSEGGHVPSLSFRTALKIPVGDQSRAFSTGQVDFGIGFAAQKMFRDRVILYLNVNEVFPTGNHIGFALHPYFISVGTAEILITPQVSVTTQISYSQSPYRGTGLNILDKGVPEVSIAFGYMFTKTLLWQIYGMEGLEPKSAVDFVLGTALTYYWRAGN